MFRSFFRVSRRFTNVGNDSHFSLIKWRYHSRQLEELKRGNGERKIKHANPRITNGTQLEEINRKHPCQLEELNRGIEEMNMNHANARITNGEQAEGVYRSIFTKMDLSILSLLKLFEMKADQYAGMGIYNSKKYNFGRPKTCREPIPEDVRELYKVYKKRPKDITYNRLLELEPSHTKEYILDVSQFFFECEHFVHPGIKKIQLQKVIPILIIMRHCCNADVQLFEPFVNPSVKETQERADMRAKVIEDIKNAMAQNLLSENWTDMHDVIQLAIKYAGCFMEEELCLSMLCRRLVFGSHCS